MLQEKAAYRNIRMLEGTSKRAAKDAREVTTLLALYTALAQTSVQVSSVIMRVMQAIRREDHRASGQECPHGVWRCKICFPHANHHSRNGH